MLIILDQLLAYDTAPGGFLVWDIAFVIAHHSWSHVELVNTQYTEMKISVSYAPNSQVPNSQLPNSQVKNKRKEKKRTSWIYQDRVLAGASRRPTGRAGPGPRGH